MSTLPVIGYTNRLSGRAGDRISVHVSATSPTISTRLVTLSTDPDAADMIPLDFEGIYPAAQHAIVTGSYMMVPGGVPLPRDGRMGLWIWPTRPASGRLQGLMSWGAEDGLFLDEAGHVMARWAGRSLVLPNRAVERRWLRISLSFEVGRLVLEASAADGGDQSAAQDAEDRQWQPVDPARFRMAAIDGADGAFDGKIARPTLESLDGDVARWSLGSDPGLRTVSDLSGHARHGVLVHRPQKGMTGPEWQGDSNGWTEAPDSYDAIAFHSDDLSDAGWPETFAFDIPATLPSGAYGVELTADGRRDVLPLFVTPPTGVATAPLALVLPTFSYLLYANERHWWPNPAIEQIAGAPLDEIVGDYDRWGSEHGLISGYDYHADGSGNAHVSMRRPLVNVRADYIHPLLRGPHQLSGDMLIVEWLRSIGQPFDILTDHEVHLRGREALAPYRAVMTGSHPEYTSGSINDAFAGYLGSGGNILHLGGNAFYFVTAAFPDEPHILEVRRGYAGVIPWQSQPGELRLASTGELGGIWRWRGRSAHQLLGAGTAAVSFGPGRPYVRTEASRDPRVAWIFKDISGDVIDAHSVLMGGPAGFEFDAARHDLGTPSDTVVLAVAKDFGPLAFLASEDMLSTGALGGAEAHLLYREATGGGRLFAAPSVAWTGCLPDRDGNNDVARITRNVLDRFLAIPDDRYQQMNGADHG